MEGRVVRLTGLSLILPFFLGGCLYASLPKDKNLKHDLDESPTSRDIRDDFNTARAYAEGARDSYNRFLTTNEAITTYGVGAPLFAAGGAALGLAAASSSSDSTLSIAELGAGGGALTGFWLWSRNKPKLDAYNEGRGALDCVIGQADQFEPGIRSFGAISQQVHSLQASGGPEDELRSQLPDIKSTLQSFTQSSSDPALKGVYSVAVTDATDVLNNANAALNDANATVALANKALSTIETVPRSLIDQVDHVDTEVRQAAYKGVPDIATANLGKLPPLPLQASATPVPAATPAPAHGAARPKDAVYDAFYSSKRKAWSSETNDLINATNALKQALTGVPGEAPDYTKCLTTLNQLLTQAQNAQAQTSPFQVLPPTDMHPVGSNTMGQITISGGKQPYTFKPDNSHLQVSTTQTTSSFWVATITITDTGADHTLAVTDSAGSQQTLTLKGGQ